MLRFNPNRWWAFVLTLCLFITCFFLLTAQVPSVASADSGLAYQPMVELPSGPAFGDPDVPMGPGDGKAGKAFVSRAGGNQVLQQSGARPVGDGAVPTSVVMDRLSLFLLSLRSFYLRF
jgi:hypothetical protein